MRLRVELPAEALAPSARLVEVGLRFGVPLRIDGRCIISDLPLRLQRGTITLITGPSGSGKSQLLAAIAREFPASRLVDRTPFPRDVAIVDAVAPTQPLAEALGILTACGLGEPMLWIRRFDQLSNGEQLRARLARTISLHRSNHGREPLLCDEFAAMLHRRLAKAIAFNLRKLASRAGLTLILATSRSDLERDLHPDCVIRLGNHEPKIEHGNGGLPPLTCVKKRGRSIASRLSGRCGVSFARHLRIERGTVGDYAAMSAMHYRQREQIGFVDRVFVMRHGTCGPVLGVIVYAYPMLELSLRNRITGGRFVRQPQRVNRDIRVLKRLVLHPDIRGCGLGHWLVRRTLPLAGVRWVECLAVMGAVHAVFDKAGMQRVGVCPLPSHQSDILARLRAEGADPLSADFASQVRRRPVVRRLITTAVRHWYRSTTSMEHARLAKQTPTALAHTFCQIAGSQPVYFMWARDRKDRAFIEAGIRGLHNR